MVDVIAIMIIPAVMFSFWKFTQRDEYSELRKAHKLNLNMYNLIAAYKRASDDPLREAHVKLARIGFWHWLAIPVAFLALLVVTTTLMILGFVER